MNSAIHFTSKNNHKVNHTSDFIIHFYNLTNPFQHQFFFNSNKHNYNHSSFNHSLTTLANKSFNHYILLLNTHQRTIMKLNILLTSLFIFIIQQNHFINTSFLTSINTTLFNHSLTTILNSSSNHYLPILNTHQRTVMNVVILLTSFFNFRIQQNHFSITYVLTDTNTTTTIHYSMILWQSFQTIHWTITSISFILYHVYDEYICNNLYLVSYKTDQDFNPK